MTQTVLITGTCSGIGRTTAGLFAEYGWNVVACMLDTECKASAELSKLENVLVVRVDVTDEATVRSCVTAALKKFGCIDVLVNNAGYGLFGPLELATREQISLQYQVNVLGSIRVMQAVIPVMRKAKSGIIINITSVLGRIAYPLMSMYIGTKYALEGISESVAIELAPFGIKVRTVIPGIVNTDFFAKGLVYAESETITAYDTMSNKANKAQSVALVNASNPIDISKVIYDAATFHGDKTRFVAGKDAEKMIEVRNSHTDEEHRRAITELLDISA